MTEAEFKEWEVRQPVRFELVEGTPKRLPEAEQGSSRLARVRLIAERALGSQAAAEMWMASAHPAIGGLEPRARAANCEDGCQLVLQALVTMGRHQETASG
jgi:uncharacterized protein (DUF2384 family)